ncbi:MAG: hypothetical protein HN356_14390 [Calditrichaeota bacterium]|nr:hypothetical protein [Calditrichota bacterium]
MVLLGKMTEKVELFLREYKFHILIPVNTILPLIVLYHSMLYPYQSIAEKPSMIFIVSVASVLNLYLCTLLGDEINKEGFKALIWAAFFNYAAFLVLIVIFFTTYNSMRRIAERDSLERMRQMLRIN